MGGTDKNSELLPNTSEYNPMSGDGELAWLLIAGFVLYAIVAPQSRYIFSNRAMSGLYLLAIEAKNACTTANFVKEYQDHRINYNLGAVLCLGVLTVFVTSLCVPSVQDPLFDNHHDMITPTGLAVLGALSVWCVFLATPYSKSAKAEEPWIKLDSTSEKRTGQQLIAAVTNAISFGAIGGGGMAYFIEHVLHVREGRESAYDGNEMAVMAVTVLSFMAMIALAIGSLSTSMNPVRVARLSEKPGFGSSKPAATDDDDGRKSAYHGLTQ